MNNLKELAKADQHIKNLSILRYDNDERAEVKMKKKSTMPRKNKAVKNSIYNVRDPFWNLKEVRVQKEPEDV